MWVSATARPALRGDGEAKDGGGDQVAHGGGSWLTGVRGTKRGSTGELAGVIGHVEDGRRKCRAIVAAILRAIAAHQ